METKEKQEKHVYKGTMHSFDELGVLKETNKAYAQQNSYSEYQNFLYNRALYGMKVYSEDEQINMFVQKRYRIEHVHTRAMKQLNVLKQSRIKELSDRVFNIFHNSKLAKAICCEEEFDESFNSKLSLRDLNISKNEVVEHFISTGILPPNFYSLVQPLN